MIGPSGVETGLNSQNGAVWLAIGPKLPKMVKIYIFHDYQLKCSMILDEKCKIMIKPFWGQFGPKRAILALLPHFCFWEHQNSKSTWKKSPESVEKWPPCAWWTYLPTGLLEWPNNSENVKKLCRFIPYLTQIK